MACYPCADGEWISIAVQTDEEWRALCEAMDQPALAARYPRFDARAARMRASWTISSQPGRAPRPPAELSDELQRRGVAAFKSLNSIDLVSDETSMAARILQSRHRPRAALDTDRRRPVADVRDSARDESCRPALGRTERLRSWGAARLIGRAAAAVGGGKSHLLTACGEIEMAIKAEDLVKEGERIHRVQEGQEDQDRVLSRSTGPTTYNATTVGMRLLYGDLIHRANIDDNVKVLVVRGAGDHFGTGGDLDEQSGAYAGGGDPSLLARIRDRRP